MKHTGDTQPASPYQVSLQEFDLREIDNPNPRALHRLKYLARLSAVLQAVQAAVPVGGCVAEVGCSQANASLLLAERGYQAVAMDLLPEALSYALMKYERGPFLPLAGSAAAFPLADNSLDAVILGELLEHCAAPAQIVAEARRVLRPGGLLIITTPNRTGQSADLPSFAQFSASPAQAQAQDQFGPHGDHHLFAFDGSELRRLLADCGLEDVRLRLVGCPIMSDKLRPLKRLLPVGAINQLRALLCRLPVLGARVGYTLVAVACKVS